eukprot:jgi/Psemu1/288547/fgenesh1_pg.270_\
MSVLRERRSVSIVLRTDDFVGVRNLPPGNVHLVTCKNGNHFSTATSNISNTNTIDTAVTVGFVVFGDGKTTTQDGSQHLIRKYDPVTEEVASEEASPIDELTRRNLLQQMLRGNNVSGTSLPPSRVLNYSDIVPGSDGDAMLSPHQLWSEQTRYITASRSLLLNEFRGLSSGDKIVPGCYDPESNVNDGDAGETGTGTAKPIADGKSLAYPPIPVVDPRASMATHKHAGTKKFLSRLEPNERTALFVTSSHNRWVWLDRVLETWYRNSWQALLGDLQLSYLLFLHLGCYSSLEHWKDLLAMLSLAVVDNSEHGDPRGGHEALYKGLLRLLPYQLSSMNDPEFLEDTDEGGGNFLIPSLARLHRYYHNPNPRRSAGCRGADNYDAESLSRLQNILWSKFPKSFGEPRRGPTITRLRSDSDSDSEEGHRGTDARMEVENRKEPYWGGIHNTAGSDFDSDEDGPVVVSSEEIEASMARSSRDNRGGTSLPTSDATTTTAQQRQQQQLRNSKQYSLLAAAIMPGEDVLMTCARALDEQTDVSLVREAAAYLQEVEQHR